MPRILAVLSLCVMFVFACGQKQEAAKPEGLTKEALGASHDLAQGKKVYEASCSSCHGIGAMGAPKTGQKADWSERVGQGLDVMVKKSIQGYEGKSGSMMPAKGGNSALTDQEVGNAVAFMVSESL